MARALWLPSVLRAAGLTVHEQPGWQGRGSDTFAPAGIVVHATAGTLTVASDIRVLLTGSTTAPPPIAQLYLARTGDWWIIASGRCNHALTGWAGPLRGLGNSSLLGVEAANDNRGEAWPTIQHESYVRGVAAICRHMRWGTDRIAGHKEHQPPGYGRASTKTDPTFAMDAFRGRVAKLLTGAPPQGDDDMLESSTAGVNTHDRLYAMLTLAPYGAAQNVPIADLLRSIAADARAGRLAVEALAAVVNAGGGSVDTAAVLARMDALAAADTARDETQAARIADLETELEQARRAAHDRARAEADALAD